MKNLKKLLVFLLAMLMVACFAACSDDDETEKNDDPTEPTLNMGSADCVHVWAEWEETAEATCTKKGTEQRSCTLCGKQEQRRILATGHYFNEGVCAACGRNERACEHQTTEAIVIKEPTCTEYGQRNVLCTICDAVIAVDKVHPTGHGEVTTIVEKEPTCTENGRAKEVCTVCGGVDHEYPIYSEGHVDTEWVVVKEPTCTENGYKQEICNTCNEIINESYPYSTGHQDTEWVVVKEPTCTEQGHKQRVCHTCNQIIDEAYPSSKGHSYQYVDAKAPTCTEAGWYEYRFCTVCDYSQAEEKARPATGHNNTAGLCGTCGATDPAFVKTDIAGITKVEHTIAKPADNVFNAPAAQLKTLIVTISSTGDLTTFNFTADNSGTYYFWITELYAGNTVKLYVKDYLGQTVASNAYLDNNEGLPATLVAGQNYTLELATRTCAVPGSYILNIGCQTAVADVSQYTAVADSMSFKDQVNVYTFIPAVDGVYRFWFSNMSASCEVNIYIYNALGEQVAGSSYCGNNEYVSISNMAAGQKYTIKVSYRSGQSAYTLNMGKQMATVDVSKYNTIHDNMFYGGQKNTYTFTVPADGDYRFELANLVNNTSVYLRLYNSLGEQISYIHGSNGNGITMKNLVAGTTYTVYVIYENGSSPYTLHIFAEKTVVQLKDNTGAADSFEYKEQRNTYTFTATEGGDYRIAITGMTAGVDVCLYIYDANGSLIKSDEWCYNGEYLTLTDLVAGATYTIVVYANGVLTEYIISVQ